MPSTTGLLLTMLFAVSAVHEGTKAGLTGGVSAASGALRAACQPSLRLAAPKVVFSPAKVLMRGRFPRTTAAYTVSTSQRSRQRASRRLLGCGAKRVTHAVTRLALFLMALMSSERTCLNGLPFGKVTPEAASYAAWTCHDTAPQINRHWSQNEPTWSNCQGSAPTLSAKASMWWSAASWHCVFQNAGVASMVSPTLHTVPGHLLVISVATIVHEVGQNDFWRGSRPRDKWKEAGEDGHGAHVDHHLDEEDARVEIEDESKRPIRLLVIL